MIKECRELLKSFGFEMSDEVYGVELWHKWKDIRWEKMVSTVHLETVANAWDIWFPVEYHGDTYEELKERLEEIL